MAGAPFPSILSFLPLLPDFVRTGGRAYADVTGFPQFFKVADIFLKAPDAKFFGAAEATQRVWGYAPPGNVCDRTLRKAVSSVSGTQESVSQARLEFTGAYSNEIGQLVGEWQQHNFQLFIFANIFSIYFQKSYKITEVVLFFTPISFK